MRVKADILHHGPDNRETAHLRREGIDLVGALSHIAKKAFDGIGALNMTMHGSRKGIKRQQMLFILLQAAHGFRVALSICGFKSLQIEQGRFFRLLFPNAREFGLHLLPFSSRDGTEHVALLVDKAALPGSGRKEVTDGSQQAIMSVCDRAVPPQLLLAYGCLARWSASPLCPPRHRHAEPALPSCLPGPLPTPLQ